MANDKIRGDLHHMKEGGFILIDDVPCRIEKIQASSSGKHGHAKFRVDAAGLFDDRRRSFVTPSGEVEIPILNKYTAQVLAINGNKVQLMDTTSFETLELDLPEDEKAKEKITQGEEVQYYEIMGIKTLKQLK
jgi:translation initiation factor 5A